MEEAENECVIYWKMKKEMEKVAWCFVCNVLSPKYSKRPGGFTQDLPACREAAHADIHRQFSECIIDGVQYT